MTTVPRCRITVLGLGVMMMMGTGPLSAQDEGMGTVTVDGETQSFTVERCSWIDHRGLLILDLFSTAETGGLQFQFQGQAWEEGQRSAVAVQGEAVEIAARQQITFRPPGHVFEARRRQASDGTWHVDPQGDPTPGRLYQIDSTTVTSGGTFRSSTTGEHHVVELSIEGVSCLLKAACVYPNPC